VVTTGNLTISGSGASTTIIDGNKGARPNNGVLFINTGATASIVGVTIRNGARNSLPTEVGGGIFNAGTLTLTNNTVSGNVAGNISGGVSKVGGGIYNAFIRTLTNSVVSENGASFGGGIFNAFNATITLIDSTMRLNNRGNSGGGIFNQGTAKVTNSTVSDNDAINGGGSPPFWAH
jgi:hypothetical protein